ncbi:ankyrin repeat domain-containing protein [Endozoicomonas sp. ONNA2]|uniref:ankyrin repeat domain-containing protein n=1 Tax=Endozoicomonas sp. ONNA2 TaxID=2828741 RepID=UPI002148F3BD|nr:ankyrin repeat domain-containing protein [Endozoicomonas sp. ONNA2]
MNVENFELISGYLFDKRNFGTRYLMDAGTGKSMNWVHKAALMEIYEGQILAECDKGPRGTAINERNIEIIDVLPTLARTSLFLEELYGDARYFSKIIDREIVNSKEAQVALEELEKQGELKIESLKTLAGIGDFIESILMKYYNKTSLSDNEKKVFKFLLTGLLKIDPKTDVANTVYMINLLSKYFNPVISGEQSELYTCILNKGERLANVIEHLWDVDLSENASNQKAKSHELYDDPLLQSIANLKKSNSLDRSLDRWRAIEKISEEMCELKARGLKDSYKEALLRLIIEADSANLLKIMINHLGINNLKVNNETRLNYAIKNGSEHVVAKLIEIDDINEPGLDGKPPLQIAIHAYQKNLDQRKNSDFLPDPYKYTIQRILECHKLCVDGEDSNNYTALSQFAMMQEIDTTIFDFIKTLIMLGANLDHPFSKYITVREFLKLKLNKQQLSDIVTLEEIARLSRIDL